MKVEVCIATPDGNVLVSIEVEVSESPSWKDLAEALREAAGELSPQ